MSRRTALHATAGLLTGALVWGLIWYPYRILAASGLAGTTATTLTYLIAALLMLPLWWRRRHRVRQPMLLLAIALAAGCCNLAYVLATLHGEVVRVLLLFYVSPLWTVILARVVLGERVNAVGIGVIGLALAGATTMLWHPDLGVPAPRNAAEWTGLTAGMFFALTNVLVRRTRDLAVESKAMAAFLGVVALGTVLHFALPRAVFGPTLQDVGMLALVGLILTSVNYAVLHALAEVPANRASVIFLFELVVAALASWLLVGEALSLRDWLGGAMIIAAGLFSSRIPEGTPPPADAQVLASR